MKAMAISRSALDVEWRRLEVIADNIANMNTTRTADGGAYTPMRLVSGPKAGFAQYLDGNVVNVSGAPTGVQVYGVVPEANGSRRVHEPTNPDADSDGYVTYPNVDQAAAMTDMIKTERAYEANLVAMNLARQMYGKALDLGKH